MSPESACDEKRMAVWQAFLRTYTTILPVLEGELRAGRGLPLIWYNVLLHLSNHSSRGLRLQELAEAVGLSQSGLTRLLDRMSAAGLLEREPCPADRRGAYAVMTATGKTLLKQATPIYQRCIDQNFLPQLSEAELEALYELFCKILAGKVP